MKGDACLRGPRGWGPRGKDSERKGKEKKEFVWIPYIPPVLGFSELLNY